MAAKEGEGWCREWSPHNQRWIEPAKRCQHGVRCAYYRAQTARHLTPLLVCGMGPRGDTGRKGRSGPMSWIGEAETIEWEFAACCSVRLTADRSREVPFLRFCSLVRMSSRQVYRFERCSKQRQNQSTRGRGEMVQSQRFFCRSNYRRPGLLKFFLVA